MLQIEHVTRIFRGPQGEVRALEDVSLTVAAGEVVVVCGPSGCGKSTLLLTAGTLLRPSAGRVLFAGDDPYALGVERRAALRAAGIGFVFQQFHLVPYLNVQDNIRLPTLAAGGRRVDAAARAAELIRQFGLEARARHVPAQLSVGERQRAALARALFNRPRLLLADEPTGNLDPANGEIVLRALADFAQAGGAVLLVTHDAAAIRGATRTLVLRAGRLETATGANGVGL